MDAVSRLGLFHCVVASSQKSPRWVDRRRSANPCLALPCDSRHICHLTLTLLLPTPTSGRVSPSGLPRSLDSKHREGNFNQHRRRRKKLVDRFFDAAVHYLVAFEFSSSFHGAKYRVSPFKPPTFQRPRKRRTYCRHAEHLKEIIFPRSDVHSSCRRSVAEWWHEVKMATLQQASKQQCGL